MTFLGTILMGFAPGLFWLWFFRRKDDLEPEPRGRLLKVFLLGCASALLLLALLPYLNPLLRPGHSGVLQDLLAILGLLPLMLIILGMKIRWSRSRSAAYHPELAE